ncbi:Signal transduction histidine kinase [Granulicatella balaenopterae]|uniref:histidine kinase n=1 Tax=Granulicatella balaenopterae TaxID=137733 RepID=A0A1H9H949_9LACT|nr:HAMP domain-containing sensor histidine kinase [Granulicatella balaenopterae]SEQ58796.1 Signal transduction histidine kinase [Granulicatella balaenopterae]
MTIFLVAIIIILVSFLWHIYHEITELTKQIDYKLTTKSNIILTSQSKLPFLKKIITNCNQLFQEISRQKLQLIKEKQLMELTQANISHDIRTPLTVAKGYLQQIESSDNSQVLIKKIDNNLVTISQRLEDLLTYQQLNEETASLTLEPVNISQALTEQLLGFYDLLLEKNFTVDLTITDDLCINQDIDSFQRICQNLFGNVIKHGEEQLSICLNDEHSQVILEISNHVQTPIDEVKRLATRFYVEDLSNFEHSSGLGLYIVKELTEKTQGTFQIDYHHPTFTIKLTWPLLEK